MHATYVQYVYLSSRIKSLCKKDTYLNRLEYLTFSNLRDIRDSYNQEFRSKDNTLAECKGIYLLSRDISTILASRSRLSMPRCFCALTIRSGSFQEYPFSPSNC